jgi:hypothetical protein
MRKDLQIAHVSCSNSHDHSPTACHAVTANCAGGVADAIMTEIARP